MKGEIIRLSNASELLYERGKIICVGSKICFIWESSEREKGVCTLTNLSMLATSCNRSTAASLAWLTTGELQLA